MKFFSIVILIAILNFSVAKKEVIDLEDFPINDETTFYSEYRNPDSEHPEILFIKKFFPNEKTTLSHDQYTYFLQDYLQTHPWKFSKVEREILKSEKEDFLTVAHSYMNEHKIDKQEYQIGNAYKDLVHGDFLHFVHDLIDHGGPVDEGEDISEDDDFGDDL